MFFTEYFSSNPRFHQELCLYYQTGLSEANPFEQSYISLRAQEGRLYTDDVVLKLPAINAGHPTAKEWKVRKHSADLLIKYLSRKENLQTIVEVGCGNGWLTNYVGKSLNKEWLGIDINLTELR